MSWLFGSKASDEESVRARKRIEELHQFYQSRLATMQAQMESLKQDHAEDMRAKNDSLTELMHQKQESDKSLLLLQDKLMKLSEELQYSNLQLQHREQEVLRSARAMVAHDFADPAPTPLPAAQTKSPAVREGKTRRGTSSSAGASTGGPNAAILGESQARMRELAEARHQRALEALEQKYKDIIDDQKRRHHRALLDAAAVREEELQAAEKRHKAEMVSAQEAHEEQLRRLHARLTKNNGVVATAVSQIVASANAANPANPAIVTSQPSASDAVAGNPSSTNSGGDGEDDAQPDLQTWMGEMQHGRDGFVQKMIARQIVLSLVKSTSRAHTIEVLGLAAKVLGFSSFERLDAGLADDGAGNSRGGLLRTMFGFGSSSSEPGTPNGSDPRATTVAISAVKALVLAFVNEEDAAEQHAILNELSRTLRFTHDERQSCSLLRESQRLVPDHPTNDTESATWLGGSADAVADRPEASTATLEQSWIDFLQFRRWGRFGSMDFNLASELKHLRQLGGGGKRGTAVRDTIRYERRLLATLQQHKESLAAQQFNCHSKQWITSAQELGILPRVQGMGEHENATQAKHVAHFFRTLPGLDKRAIGDWLSEPPDRFPFNNLVLRAFTLSFDFAQPGYQGKFCDALRDFLAAFRLPGEAQKIDRLVEAFARELFRATTADVASGTSASGSATNPSAGVFASADAVYVLAFSTVMLNTDLHNPMMEDHRRMTLEAFINNNQGINDEEDLPREFLTDLYNDIKGNEIKKDCDPFTS